METSQLSTKKRNQMLIKNDLDWYVVDYDDNTTKLIHTTGLSNVLQCGQDASDFGILNIQQCWNGEDLSD